ncbi:hypothetical protein BS50DRAFT_494740 [Corynespora cassiicola Philippines]|uniref:C3H1-type domain-containing protein n=1 Tax=Corynespora cassiicola Philippines TaxID=1448308 RepID=A0A2T2NM61_CORCC|nr:hypothetical protein BS50DRAFT_494740 [Corynespora cassiicola Philippines]
MWAISPSRKTKQTECPYQLQRECKLPNCIFRHDAAVTGGSTAAEASDEIESVNEPDRKLMKLNDGTRGDSSHAGTSPQPSRRLVSAQASANASPSTSNSAPSATPFSKHTQDKKAPAAEEAPEAKAASQPDTPVSLIPRKLPHEPVIMSKRTALLQVLKGAMVPLNDKMKRAKSSEHKKLHLSDNQLNKLAVDEEEKVGIENNSVYENVMKQRIMALRKMDANAWIQERNMALAKEKGSRPKKAGPKRVNTGLDAKLEVEVVHERLTADAEEFEDYSYITDIPKQSDVDQCLSSLQTNGGWEKCDRCQNRFQVFPERRETDGLHTTGGECVFHWGRRSWMGRSHKYTCCNEHVGTPGCTAHSTHVFKVSDAARLHVMMPFIETPKKDNVSAHPALSMDCEMAYTTQGLELIRMTAVSWPAHRRALDVLVRPLGALLDLNTRFSGITKDQFLNAKPYDPKDSRIDPKNLRIVESPLAARDLLVSYMSRSTVLMGHSLENDLRALRLIHDYVADSAICFPHKQGPPYRLKLRELAKNYLDWDIQQGGAAGHDSAEDARAAGELIRYKVMREWKHMKEDGWEAHDGKLYPPLPVEETTASSPSPEPSSSSYAPTAPSMIPVAESSQNSNRADKRKYKDFEDDA